jgi:hypothetical protein
MTDMTDLATTAPIDGMEPYIGPKDPKPTTADLVVALEALVVELRAKIAKLIEAREIAAIASATLREESLAHQRRVELLDELLRDVVRFYESEARSASLDRQALVQRIRELLK